MMKKLYIIQTNIEPIYMRLDLNLTIRAQEKHIDSLIQKVRMYYPEFDIPFLAFFDKERYNNIRSRDTFEPGYYMSESPSILGFNIQNHMEPRNNLPSITAILDYNNGNSPTLEKALDLLSKPHDGFIPQEIYDIRKIQLI